jgi:GT2 family glycosyltransferase/ubiquinone/menaquinone biosynthesis C-methylase UbiE
MDTDKITVLINSGEWEQAWAEFKDAEISDDTTAILKASLYEHFGMRDRLFDCICDGLGFNSKNYELYVMLGNYFQQENINKAYLCYENALFFCDNDEDRGVISDMLKAASEQSTVQPCSVVIVSYNSKKIMQECIESIRENNPTSAYQLVVVDNASTDGVTDWLREQDDIVLIENKENKGFGYACNQGVKASAWDNDIFFLNNDTIVFQNSIFGLRMGLYDNEKNGAVGAVTNYATNSQLAIEPDTPVDKCREFAIRRNIPNSHPYELRSWLVGFAVMCARPVLDKVGLFDLDFGMGFYEDNDLSVRINLAGYRTVLCLNSFIYHYGSASFSKRADLAYLPDKNLEVFKEKYHFDPTYCRQRSELLQFITHGQNASFRVLEVGCGTCETLAAIQRLYPNAVVKGIELNEMIVRMMSHSIDVIQGNIETMTLPYEKKYFDYIIFADVLEHLHAPEKVLVHLRDYLADDGHIICSVPNILHASVMIGLVNGEFSYSDSGILDRTHLRLFTMKSAARMLIEAGYKIDSVSSTQSVEDFFDDYKETIDALTKLLGDNAQQLHAYQLIFNVRKG